MATEIKTKGAYNKARFNKNQKLSDQILNNLGVYQFRAELGNALNILNINGSKRQEKRLLNIIKKINSFRFNPATYISRRPEFGDMKEFYKTSFVRKDGKLYLRQEHIRDIEISDVNNYASVLREIERKRQNRSEFYLEEIEFFQEKIAGRKKKDWGDLTKKELGEKYKSYKIRKNKTDGFQPDIVELLDI